MPNVRIFCYIVEISLEPPLKSIAITTDINLILFFSYMAFNISGKNRNVCNTFQ